MNAAANAAYTVEALGASIEVVSPLSGAHQHRNVALAIAAAVELAISHGFPITAQSITQGIRNTHWPARFERLTSGGIDWILDVAHNPAGAWALRANLRDTFGSMRLGTLVFSCLRDKPVTEMAQILFPLFDKVIFAPIHSSRAIGMIDLQASAAITGTPAFAATTVTQALELARERSSSSRPVVVSGSVYLVGEVRSILLAAESGQHGQTAERVVHQS
jgi:dihydrofolate synthase/folylpolyglutamate synthase